MKVIVIGGDGFCGWPTSLHLSKIGHKVFILDNLSRRRIDKEIGSNSLTKIATIDERIKCANENNIKLEFENIDVIKQYNLFVKLVKKFKPNVIVHFGEQRAAPYSMIGDEERRYTVDNNIISTHNICSTIIEANKNIHLIHLGSMGVYGYTNEMGQTPEGYLNVKIDKVKKKKKILYPVNPGSIYHMTKCLDQIMFQFYNKNWKIRITDLHQGIVWGTQTEQTMIDKKLINRFDYDGIYGTVLNRFIIQAANNHPLSVYGTGGQARAFMHISDTAKCIELAIKNDKFYNNNVRIFNQVSEIHKVRQLAKLISKKFNVKINYINNPRKELADNDLKVSTKGFMKLGFKPKFLNDELISEVKFIASKTKRNFKLKNVNNSPRW